MPLLGNAALITGGRRTMWAEECCFADGADLPAFAVKAGRVRRPSAGSVLIHLTMCRENYAVRICVANALRTDWEDKRMYGTGIGLTLHRLMLLAAIVVAGLSVLAVVESSSRLALVGNILAGSAPMAAWTAGAMMNMGSPARRAGYFGSRCSPYRDGATG